MVLCFAFSFFVAKALEVQVPRKKSADRMDVFGICRRSECEDTCTNVSWPTNRRCRRLNSPQVWPRPMEVCLFFLGGFSKFLSGLLCVLDRFYTRLSIKKLKDNNSLALRWAWDFRRLWVLGGSFLTKGFWKVKAEVVFGRFTTSHEDTTATWSQENLLRNTISEGLQREVARSLSAQTATQSEILKLCWLVGVG